MLLPLGKAQGFAQSEENHRAWLRALDSLSSERMLADVMMLSSFHSMVAKQEQRTIQAQRNGSPNDFMLPVSVVPHTRFDPPFPLQGPTMDTQPGFYDNGGYRAENCTGSATPHFNSQ